jgi:choline dehydrogenase
MQSGIGDQAELGHLKIPPVQHLPGVGHNLQDHFLVYGCVWEYRQPSVIPNAARAVLFWKTDRNLDPLTRRSFKATAGGSKPR